MSVPHYIYKNWDDVKALFFFPIDFFVAVVVTSAFFLCESYFKRLDI